LDFRFRVQGSILFYGPGSAGNIIFIPNCYNAFTICKGNEIPANTGKLFYFHPKLSHSLISSNDNPMQFWAVHFSFTYLHFINNKWTIYDTSSNLPLPHAIELKNHLIISDLMRKINDIWRKKYSNYEFACSGLFSQLLFHIFEDYKINSFNYAYKRNAEKAIKYIQDNIGKTLTAKSVAEKINLSPDYLSSIFKKYIGYSLLKYINKCRIDMAKKLITNKKLKLRDIADIVGFCDEFYLSKVFKKYEGISPSQFKEKI
jgi:AraC family transcriptional regulator, transcriptional activator for feuABC-ybbA operon